MSFISRDLNSHHTGTVPLCSTTGSHVLDAANVHALVLLAPAAASAVD